MLESKWRFVNLLFWFGLPEVERGKFGAKILIL